MTARTPQPVFPYSVKINTATGTDVTLPITLLTPKQAEELQIEFKKIARDAGVRGARISVQRLAVDDYDSRRRDHDRSQPPPQIRTGGITASGSHLG